MFVVFGPSWKNTFKESSQLLVKGCDFIVLCSVLMVIAMWGAVSFYSLLWPGCFIFKVPETSIFKVPGTSIFMVPGTSIFKVSSKGPVTFNPISGHLVEEPIHLDWVCPNKTLTQVVNVHLPSIWEQTWEKTFYNKA